MTKNLTPKQEDFLEALLGEARGNIRIAMDIAGYSKMTKNAEVVGPLKDETTKAGEDDARNYFKKRFVKVFKYWETIDQNELKAYVRGRQDGSDGDRAWSDRTFEKNLNLVKQFWNWMLDNDHVECPNLIDAARLMKRKANTKTNRSETNADANLPYSIEEAGLS